MTDRIIFLDFDGVLNNGEWFRDGARQPARDAHCHVCADSVVFDPVNVRRLNRIVTASGAKIVVSSSWRNAHPRVADLRHLLRHGGVEADVVDKTPSHKEERFGIRIGFSSRGAEIQHWLVTTTRRVESFVILDDVNAFADFGADRFIQTSFGGGGLLDEHVDRAIVMLTERCLATDTGPLPGRSMA